MRRLSLGLALFVCWLGLTLTSSGQALFKTGTRTVAVYATVTEPGGRLVPDLTRDDFEIEDDGKPQDITIFANEIQPITVVMLLDRSGSMEGNFDLVREAAEKFVAELGPADKARVGSFSNRIQVDPRTFTSDRDELIGILRTQLQERGPTPLWNAVNVGITALLHEEGRRVILVFTDGTDFPMNFRTNNSTLKDVMKRADEENVMVYAIGFNGQRVPTGISAPGGRGAGRGGRGGSRVAPAATPPIMPMGKPDPGLTAIAAETGGGYFEVTSTTDLAQSFRRVADELHHQYVIGFSPGVLDGKTHRLTLRVKSSGLQARARRSYLATKEQ
jgi:Ca-activated chloride channel family protein